MILDVTTAEHASGGIGVVARGLLAALPTIADGPEITVLAGPTTALADGQPARHFRMVASSTGRILFQRLLFPAAMAWEELRRGHVDRFVHIDACYPLWSLPGEAGRTTVFIHDLLPVTHPEFFTARKDVFKRLAFRSIHHFRPQLATSCSYTATEIERVLGLPSRIVQFGCGQFNDAEAVELLQLPPRDRGNFVLYVGAVEPRKDLKTLMLAVDLASKSDPGLRLALVGDWSTPAGLKIRRWAHDSEIGSTRFLGRVSTTRLRDLLLHARVLVYPSAAEGFGLPVLEALAASTPVVATDLPAIRSWAGDCVGYFPAGNAPVLAEQIAAADVDQARVARGRQLSEVYRWAKFARDFLDADATS